MTYHINKTTDIKDYCDVVNKVKKEYKTRKYRRNNIIKSNTGNKFNNIESNIKAIWFFI